MKSQVDYTNGEITIVWKPALCIHSAICAQGLPDVFQPHLRPWIDTEGSTTQGIIEQVKQCPSGAISYYYNKEKANNGE